VARGFATEALAAGTFSAMSSRAVVKRTLIGFYDNQMTHHAAALTYYALMSLFPTLLLGISLLGLLGQYPETYDAVLGFLRDVAPDSTLGTLDAALRGAFESKGTALVALIVGALLALYGTTGVLEAARRALNVALEVDSGRSFLQRKGTDVVSSIVLLVLVLLALILMFVGGGLATELFELVGLGSTAADAWAIGRWPAAVAVAMLVFSWVYYVTPDVKQRGFRGITPGAAVGVAVWLGASALFSLYLSSFGELSGTYGSFGAAIILIVWLWLTNVALLFGAQLNAEIEREKELSEGVPPGETIDLPGRG